MDGALWSSQPGSSSFAEFSSGGAVLCSRTGNQIPRLQAIRTVVTASPVGAAEAGPASVDVSEMYSSRRDSEAETATADLFHPRWNLSPPSAPVRSGPARTGET